MKKFFAGLLAAALVASPSAAFAETAAAPGVDADVIIGVEAQGTNLEGTINVKVDGEGDSALSFNLGVPAGENTMSLDLPDVIRMVDDTVYVNAKGIADFYQMLTGDTSVSETLSTVGIDSWVAIQPITIVWNQEAIQNLMSMVNFQPSEQLQASLAALAQPFEVTETEESITIKINNDTVINFVESIDQFFANNKEELAGAVSALDLSALFNVIDFKATFGEYVKAYAEGRASVTGENVDNIVNEIFGYLNMGISMVSRTVKSYTGNFDLQQIPDLSDALTEKLQGVVIDGEIVIGKAAPLFDAKVTVTANEQTVDFTIHAEATENGVYATASATQDGQELASSEFSVAAGDNSFDASFVVVSQGQEALNFKLNGALTDEALNGNLVITAGGKTLEGKVEAHPTEAGLEGTFNLTFDGQPVIDGTIKAGNTEEGLVFDITVTAQGQTVNVKITAADMGGRVDISLLDENGQVVETFAVYGSVSMNEAAADLDITAPENSATLIDVIRNVSAMYYTMKQQSQQTEEAAPQQ